MARSGFGFKQWNRGSIIREPRNVSDLGKLPRFENSS